ncbi:hypothetical protein HYV85_01575 [Candidatus Woesearchaeota archaeon]|nr:hypothetical protein [Candidatus Woesearchaeota archaeon]
MKPLTTALAAGITTAMVYAVCVVLWAGFPSGMMGYAGSMMHGVNRSIFAVQPFAPLTLLLGAAYSFITAFLIGGLFAIVYNWVEKNLKEKVR